jgi:hypothetical protein
MRRSSGFAILYAAACLCANFAVSGQNFRVDSVRLDSFGGLVTLAWQSQPGEVYGVHTSTDLTTWEELQSGFEPLRLQAASGNQTQTELALPAGPQRFWQVRRRSITDLGTLLPADQSGPVPTDVNDTSRVVGYFETSRGGQTGFTWAPGEGLHSFGPDSYAVAVNASGTVFGNHLVDDVGTFFSWTKSGGLIDLGAGSAVDANAAGHIAGRDSDGAFLWKSGVGKIRIPSLLPNEPFSAPNSMSDAGHVVGASRDGGSTRAFLWTESGGVVDLTAGTGSAATHVNSSGLVAGYRFLPGVGQQRAFAWTASGGLVTFPTGCVITDLNENGVAVGHGYQPDANTPEQAFSWTQAGGIVTLGAGGQPESVNNLGQIVGSKVGRTGFLVPILWSPTGNEIELERLSSEHSRASLINNNGVVFGQSGPRLNPAASHLVMWTINPTP